MMLNGVDKAKSLFDFSFNVETGSDGRCGNINAECSDSSTDFDKFHSMFTTTYEKSYFKNYLRNKQNVQKNK